MNIKIFSFLVLSLIWVSPIEAGVRCTLGGDTGCSAGCALLGQTSGICDDEGNFGIINGTFLNRKWISPRKLIPDQGKVYPRAVFTPRGSALQPRAKRGL